MCSLFLLFKDENHFTLGGESGETRSLQGVYENRVRLIDVEGAHYLGGTRSGTGNDSLLHKAFISILRFYVDLGYRTTGMVVPGDSFSCSLFDDVGTRIQPLHNRLVIVLVAAFIA